MKDITIYIAEYARLPLAVLLIFFSAANVFGQNQNAGILQSKRDVYKACGDYPGSGTLVHGFSVLIAGKECNTIITENSSTVYFTANDKVILHPGFRALSGSKFIARIEPNGSSPQTNVPGITGKTNENITQDLTVFPNPSAGKFITMINCGKTRKVQVSIYNSSGLKIVEKAGINLVKGLNELTFNLSNHAAGVYMLEVNFGGSKIVKKIIKSE